MKNKMPSIMMLMLIVLTSLSSFIKRQNFFNNLIYCVKTGPSSYLYTMTNPFPFYACLNDVTFVACTLSTTATVGYFNLNNTTVFPTQSSIPGAPKVTFLHAGKIYK